MVFLRRRERGKSQVTLSASLAGSRVARPQRDYDQKIIFRPSVVQTTSRKYIIFIAVHDEEFSDLPRCSSELWGAVHVICRNKI